MFKTHYPTNIILDIIEKGIGRASSLFFYLADLYLVSNFAISQTIGPSGFKFSGIDGGTQDGFRQSLMKIGVKPCLLVMLGLLFLSKFPLGGGGGGGGINFMHE